MKVLIVSIPFPLSSNALIRAYEFDEILVMAKMGLQVYVARAVRPFDGGHAIISNVSIYNMKYDAPSSASILLKNLSYFPLNSIIRPKFAFLPLYGSHIAKIAKKHVVDVIHAHFAFREGFAALLAKNVTKKPLVISVWGQDVQSDPRTGYGMLSRKHIRNMVVKALKEADAITVGAESHYQAVKGLIGEDKANKIFFVPPGIDTNRFNPSVDGSKVREKYNIKPHQSVILFARHLLPIYGVEDLLKAAAKVIRVYREAVFLIIGDGPQKNYLQELARRLALTKNVAFLGYVPRNEMPFYQAASDIFVDPCIFGQGYASLEALSSGKPVIGLKAGQIRIIDKVEGYLIQPGNIEELADKIIELLGDSELRKKMGMKGRKRVVEEISMEKRVNMLKSLYNKLLAA